MIQKCRHFPVQKEGLDMRKTLIVLHTHTHTHTHTHLIIDKKKISSGRPSLDGLPPLRIWN